MVVACAVAGAASHIVTRDLDLLSLETYEGIAMVTPEVFLALLRGEAKR
jgi:predicted nucleic acid-binding protein